MVVAMYGVPMFETEEAS